MQLSRAASPSPYPRTTARLLGDLVPRIRGERGPAPTPRLEAADAVISAAFNPSTVEAGPRRSGWWCPSRARPNGRAGRGAVFGSEMQKTRGFAGQSAQPENDSPRRGEHLRTLHVQLVAPLPPPYGGIAHWTQMLLRHAVRCPGVRLHVVDTAPRWRTIHDVRLWKRAVGGSIQLVRDLARVARALLRKPDAIHLTTSGQLAVVRDLCIASIARIFRVALVYHIRFGRIPAIAEADTREWKVLRAVIRSATVVVPIDEATESTIRAHEPRANVERIPNCVDPQELPVPPAPGDRAPTVVYLGWVIPTKGIAELVHAWSTIDTRGWRLLLAGPADDEYRRQLAGASPPPNLEFTGELPHADAMQAVARADVIVLPSYTEGFPNVILEAMTLGRAIVATDVGAIPEMLRDGRGVLVPPRDAAALASALARVMADGELRRELGARARAHAHAVYSIDAVFKRYVKLWSGAQTRPRC